MLLLVTYCLFVGKQAYNGMIIGEHSQDKDLDVRRSMLNLLYFFVKIGDPLRL